MSPPVGCGQERFVSEFDVPRLCDLNRSSAVLDGMEWVIACQVDGQATVRELAGRSGLQLRDAMESVTRLMRSGLCTIDAGEAPDGGNQWRPDDVAASLPRRARETVWAATPSAARTDIGLLKRILDGLNSLD